MKKIFFFLFLTCMCMQVFSQLSQVGRENYLRDREAARRRIYYKDTIIKISIDRWRLSQLKAQRMNLESYVNNMINSQVFAVSRKPYYPKRPMMLVARDSCTAMVRPPGTTSHPQVDFKNAAGRMPVVGTGDDKADGILDFKLSPPSGNLKMYVDAYLKTSETELRKVLSNDNMNALFDTEKQNGYDVYKKMMFRFLVLSQMIQSNK